MISASGSLVLDACVVINLAASGEADAILGATGCTCVMVPDVSREVARLRGRAAFNMPSINVADLDAREVAMFVELAEQLDDGEAATISVAATRGFAVGTDDRAACRVAAQLRVSVVGTPELVHSWACSSCVTAARVGAAVRRIVEHARYRPRRDDPLHEWWAAAS